MVNLRGIRSVLFSNTPLYNDVINIVLSYTASSASMSKSNIFELMYVIEDIYPRLNKGPEASRVRELLACFTSSQIRGVIRNRTQPLGGRAMLICIICKYLFGENKDSYTCFYSNKTRRMILMKPLPSCYPEFKQTPTVKGLLEKITKWAKKLKFDLFVEPPYKKQQSQKTLGGVLSCTKKQDTKKRRKSKKNGLGKRLIVASRSRA